MAWTDGLTGRIILQNASGYEEARRNFNARFSKYPKVIVYCQTAQDAANAVQWVRKQKVPFSVRCGGHSYEAFSLVDGGLIIDVSDLLHLRIDKASYTVSIGAGFRMQPLYEALWKNGLTIPGGTCPTIGVSGLTLGGGYGLLSRLFGMTCDNLLEVEMVNAQGKIIRANEKYNSDLLWACRGGGDGSFGVITSITYRVFPIGDVALCKLTWDFSDLENVVRFWQTWAPNTDTRLTSQLKLPALNQGDIESFSVFVGLEKELRRFVRPLQEALPPKMSSIRSASWIDAARRIAGMPTRQVKFKHSSAYAYEPFSDAALIMLIKNLKNPSGTSNFVELNAYGGAIFKVPPDATAFVHRKALFGMQYQTYWEQDSEEVNNILWVKRFRESMLPFTQGAYRNYSDRLIDNWQTAYFGENIIRLKQVKQARTFVI
jgi:FAD/FMN-containing dehydrogenase